MKLLFFDIECARCFKHMNGVICEFGYVLADEKLTVLQKEVLLIAPEVKFDWYVIKKMLAFTEEEYNASPTFPAQYEKIKSLLTDGDTTVIGHTTDIDAHYLNFAARRYELPFINFEFYDMKNIHMHKRKLKKGVSVENMLNDLEIEFDGHLHRSDEDAYATLLVLKELCNRSGLDCPAVLSEYAGYKGGTSDGKIKKAKTPPMVYTEEEIAAMSREKLERFADKLEHLAVKNVVDKKNFYLLAQLKDGDVQGDIIQSKLKGKKVSIDRDYQKTHFKEMLSLISLVKQYGGIYTFNVEDCDIFVEGGFDGEREFAHYKKIAARRKAKIITLEQLLSVLCVTEQDLLIMPFPPRTAFKKIKKSRRTDGGNGGEAK